MPAPETPWARRLREILADGEWHNYEDVLTELATLVPPGRAFRVTKNEEEQQQKRGHAVKTRDHQESIRYGARRLATSVITARRQDIEVRVLDDVKEIRSRSAERDKRVHAILERNAEQRQEHEAAAGGLVPAGWCPECRAPVYLPGVWHGVEPPEKLYTCDCRGARAVGPKFWPPRPDRHAEHDARYAR